MIPGWNSDITPWQKEYAHRIPHGGTYLEVGVFLGASLATMGALRPDINLIAVDPWPETWGTGEHAAYVEERGGLWLAFLKGMMAHAPDVLRRTQIIRGTADTIQIATHVDMLFIDGDHRAESVRKDLTTFAPLVWTGIVAGHDYSPDYLDVKAEVDQYFGRPPNVGIPGGGWSSVWWVAR
jgi:hypothetical protein